MDFFDNISFQTVSMASVLNTCPRLAARSPAPQSPRSFHASLVDVREAPPGSPPRLPSPLASTRAVHASWWPRDEPLTAAALEPGLLNQYISEVTSHLDTKLWRKEACFSPQPPAEPVALKLIAPVKRAHAPAPAPEPDHPLTTNFEDKNEESKESQPRPKHRTLASLTRNSDSSRCAERERCAGRSASPPLCRQRRHVGVGTPPRGSVNTNKNLPSECAAGRLACAEDWLGGVRALRDSHVRLVLRQLRHIARLNRALDRAVSNT